MVSWLKIRDAIHASPQKMSLLQTMVPTRSAQSPTPTLLFQNFVPKVAESRHAKALVGQISGLLEWTGTGQKHASLAR
jgi:hypothetical protein